MFLFARWQNIGNVLKESPNQQRGTCMNGIVQTLAEKREFIAES